VRVGLDLLGGGPAWWGLLLIAVGAGSALLGVLYALTEDDLKRLLAYSSVENVGLITLGVGAGFLFQSLAMPGPAALAIAAALYHALNHAAFKGLLFLGAGSVVHATGTRSMNRHGGLIRRMPWTAPCFLVGAVAIAGLPPLNGSFSEWLLFQALLPGIGTPSPLVAVLMVLALGMLALTAGLAAATFAKAFGITFLALPRSDGAAHAHEVPLSMRAGMVALAGACGLLALGALPLLATAGAVASGLLGLAAQPPTLRLWFSFQTPAGRGDGGVAGRPPARLPASSEARRHLGLRTGGADRADGVHRDRVRGAVAPHLLGALPADRGRHDRPSPGIALFRAVDRLPGQHPALVRALSLRARDRVGAAVGTAHARAAVRLGARVPHVRGCGPRAAARGTDGHRCPVSAISGYALAIGQALLAFALAPGLIGLIRWLKARMQNRRGAPIWQPYLELRKLFAKEVVVSTNASWLFRLAPYVVFASTGLVTLLLPILAVPLPLDPVGDLLVVVYLLLLGPFFLALAGLDPGSAFGGMGSSREMTVAALAEPTIAVAIFALALGAGSTNLGQIVARALARPAEAISPGYLLAFTALFIVTLAETGRLPVDNPATHLELTMIHEAMVLEYSGRYLALIEWAAALKLLIFFSLLANLFVPWGVTTRLDPGPLLLAVLVYVAKLAALALAVAVFETRVAKLRLFRVPELLSVSFVLALLAITASFLSR
jgi:formate hydrogenlyase subunit 4